MSGQLGGQLGISVAPDELLVKTRAIYGSSVQNAPPAQGQLLPQFLGFNKGGHSGLETPAGIQQLMLAGGRIKKFGIYIKRAVTWGGDANFVLRKNGANFSGAPIITIPFNVSDGTLFLTADNLDLEFVAGDFLNFRLFLLAGTGRYFASWSIDIEWDTSSSSGDFPADIITVASPRPILAAVRRNLPNHSNWISIDPDTMAMPALYSGKFIANSGRVATGFGLTRAKKVSASVVTAPTVRTDKLTLNWIIGETGSKILLGSESFSASHLINQSIGQTTSSFNIEPSMGLYVARMDFP